MIVNKSNKKYNYDTNPPTLDNNKLKSLIDFEFTSIDDSLKKLSNGKNPILSELLYFF